MLCKALIRAAKTSREAERYTKWGLKFFENAKKDLKKIKVDDNI
jgi:hypothetical protein